MLRTETVESGTFELLKTLMQDEHLKNFNLVGGTALALYMGHRKSIDLDLFSQQSFDTTDLEKYLNDTCKFNFLKSSNATLMGEINGIKVDFISYNYPLVNPVVVLDGIRLLSIQDIAAMKLTAISQNGSRLKDFVDIAFLSTKMSLTDMLNAFKIKFPRTDIITALKSITYFGDIDFSTKIELVEGIFNWKPIEKRLNEMIKFPNKIFLTYPTGYYSRPLLRKRCWKC
jgi:hypothetical protein